MNNLKETLKTILTTPTTVGAGGATFEFPYSTKQKPVINTLKERISEAWEIWDLSILTDFFEGAKPELPTSSFIEDFIENEDLEEIWKISYLTELFA